MVAGKVKAVMGLQKSPATPKIETSRRSSSSPNIFNGKTSSVFSRSFGVYFPRSSSQVQPRPPDATDLIRLIEDLQEKVSLLKTELLEQKILKETVALVPFLENEVSSKNGELDRVKNVVKDLEAENRALRMEVEALLDKVRGVEEEGRRKEVEIEELKRAAEDCASSSSRFQGLIDVSAKSVLLKNVRKSPPKFVAARPDGKDLKGEEREIDRVVRGQKEGTARPRIARIPKPPPLPSASLCASSRIAGTNKAILMRPPPPPPPPPPAFVGKSGEGSVRRVPEVVEFYHSMMRRDAKRDSGGGGGDVPAAANARNMIGEIENRSAHLLAIKTDVETQGDFIRFLINEVENASFSNIEDLVSFVKWLDDELSFLVDERAVLKHFDWPESKSDAMREAAFGYWDLRKLEIEASSFRDDPRQPCSSAIKKMQSMLEKLEHGIFNLSRVREGATERYKNFQIPWEWMLDSGIVSQIKLASVKLAKKYMKRVTFEISAIAGGSEEEDLTLQGVRFAFRVHQFAGGFDVETMRVFQELKDKARKRQADKQNQQQQQKLFNRSTSSMAPC